MNVVNVIRANHLELEFVGELQQPGNDLPLFGDSVILNLDEIIFAAKDFDETATRLARVFLAIVQQVLRDDRSETARKADESCRVFRQRLKIGPGLVVE